MQPFGGGPLQNIQHKHFWRVLISFICIVGIAMASYHWWLKHEVVREANELHELEAQRQAVSKQKLR